MTESQAGLPERSLTEALWHDEPTVAERAARALAELGPPAVPALLPVLARHPLADVRRVAAVALARLVAADDVPPDEIAPALARSLREDPDIWARHRHGREWDRLLPGRPGLELVRLGARAAPAVPLLTCALGDASPVARYWAAATLAAIGPAAEPACPVLISALQDESWEIRNDAAAALGTIGPAAQAALPSLLGSMLAEEQPEARVTAALAAWRIGRRREGIPVLIDVLGLRPPPRSVLLALAEIGRPAAMALPALEASQWVQPRSADEDDGWPEIDDLSLDANRETARVRLRYGPDDPWWLCEVRGSLSEAERAWWAEHELPAVRLGLQCGDEDVCVRAAQLLGQLAPAGSPDVLHDLVAVAMRLVPHMSRARETALACLAKYVEPAPISRDNLMALIRQPAGLFRAKHDEAERIAEMPGLAKRLHDSDDETSLGPDERPDGAGQIY